MSADGGDGAGGGGGAEGEAFVELLLQEVRNGDMDCPSVQMLVDMAKSGDNDTVADALCFLVESAAPDKAASCLRYVMSHVQPPAPPPEPAAGETKPGADAGNTVEPAQGGDAAKKQPAAFDFKVGGKIMNRLIELDHLAEAQDLVKFLLVSRDTDRGRGAMLDCYDVSLLLGSMVPTGGAESAGRLLFALYSSDGGEDAAASQTLVPFILGTLVDHGRVEWAAELGKQLMYTTLEEIEAGVGEYDYSVLGWCLAQMVWYGRADWAAQLCLDLERQQLEWYNGRELLNSVAGWGDASYSATIANFMQERRAKERKGA